MLSVEIETKPDLRIKGKKEQKSSDIMNIIQIIQKASRPLSPLEKPIVVVPVTTTGWQEQFIVTTQVFTFLQLIVN